jgi:drug/metabolite transporter (DMT)-like permease
MANINHGLSSCDNLRRFAETIAIMKFSFKAKMLAAFAAVYLVWGSTYLAIALGIETIPPFLLMGLRSLIGGAILLGWARSRALGSDQAMSRREDWPEARAWAHAAICGLLFFLGCHGVLAYAEKEVPSGIAAIVLATIPFWIVLLKLVLGDGKRPQGLTLLALVPGFAGVALIAWREAASPDRPIDPGMILLLLASAFSWALGSVISQRHPSSVSAPTLSGMQLLCGGAALVLCSVFGGELAGFAPTDISSRSLAGLAYLALAGTVLGFLSYIWLLDHVPAPVVSTYTFVNPIIAVVLGWLFLNERMTLEMLAGAALVVASVIAVGFLDSSRRAGAART